MREYSIAALPAAWNRAGGDRRRDDQWFSKVCAKRLGDVKFNVEDRSIGAPNITASTA